MSLLAVLLIMSANSEEDDEIAVKKVNPIVDFLLGVFFLSLVACLGLEISLDTSGMVATEFAISILMVFFLHPRGARFFKKDFWIHLRLSRG